MSVLKIKRFAFKSITYEGLVEAAKNNSTPDAERQLAAYERKYAKEISELKDRSNKVPSTNSKPVSNSSVHSSNKPNFTKQKQPLANSKRINSSLKSFWKKPLAKLGTGIAVGTALAYGGHKILKNRDK